MIPGPDCWISKCEVKKKGRVGLALVLCWAEGEARGCYMRARFQSQARGDYLPGR